MRVTKSVGVERKIFTRGSVGINLLAELSGQGACLFN